jgi:hypothetical protein
MVDELASRFVWVWLLSLFQASLPAKAARMGKSRDSGPAPRRDTICDPAPYASVLAALPRRAEKSIETRDHPICTQLIRSFMITRLNRFVPKEALMFRYAGEMSRQIWYSVGPQQHPVNPVRDRRLNLVIGRHFRNQQFTTQPRRKSQSYVSRHACTFVLNKTLMIR